ncbi:MAG: outer membrane beta-barrel protein [Opitutaceae bacterium]|nr:outer membrane beta-barrel protein [Opitutaceae bacterium]
MSKLYSPLLPLLGLWAASNLGAVYAPIPEQEQGKDFTAAIRVGASHDSNIFGAATGAVSSAVYTVEPSLKLNRSLSDQTFFSASYRLTLDRMEDRPGDRTLDSHDANVRLAHAFSQATNIDLSDNYTVAKNPESLLAGIPLNTDQSFERNQLDGRFVTNLTERANATLKARTVHYRYDNATLGASLDRTENLLGAAVSIDVVPELKAVGEYRFQDVGYRSAGASKDKQSNFLIGGFDYELAKKLTASGRLGYEWRQREGAGDTDVPYVELSGKYDYAEKSYITGGYIHTIEEASNVAQFTDTRVNRLFVNIQHSVSALIVTSTSLTYEPSTLLGRAAQADVDETTTRFGFAMSYLPTQNWTISATYDNDRVKSDDPNRELKRNRYGLSAAFSF